MNRPEGYVELNLPYNIGADRKLFQSTDGRKIHLRLYGHPSEKKVRGPVQFDDYFHGPPGHVHGGAQAYVLDEVMGTAAWHSGIPVVAQTISVNFYKMVPIGPVLTLEGEVTSESQRKIEIIGTLYNGEEKLASSSGIFHRMEYERFKHFIDNEDLDMSRWFPESK